MAKCLAVSRQSSSPRRKAPGVLGVPLRGALRRCCPRLTDRLGTIPSCLAASARSKLLAAPSPLTALFEVESESESTETDVIESRFGQAEVNLSPLDCVGGPT